MNTCTIVAIKHMYYRYMYTLLDISDQYFFYFKALDKTKPGKTDRLS